MHNHSPEAHRISEEITRGEQERLSDIESPDLYKRFTDWASSVFPVVIPLKQEILVEAAKAAGYHIVRLVSPDDRSYVVIKILEKPLGNKKIGWSRMLITPPDLPNELISMDEGDQFYLSKDDGLSTWLIGNKLFLLPTSASSGRWPGQSWKQPSFKIMNILSHYMGFELPEPVTISAEFLDIFIPHPLTNSSFRMVGGENFGSGGAKAFTRLPLRSILMDVMATTSTNAIHVMLEWDNEFINQYLDPGSFNPTILMIQEGALARRPFPQEKTAHNESTDGSEWVIVSGVLQRKMNWEEFKRDFPLSK